MIFAIHKAKPEDPGEGRFTKGMLYLATPEMNGSEVVNVDKMQVVDDDGERVWIEADGGRFEYPEEVYAVIVKAVGSKTPGEVVVVTEADDKGEFLCVKGIGYVRACHLQLLDSTIVKPGMMVYDLGRMRWDRIRRVDECMRLCLEDCDGMRECTEFMFSVTDEELATVPLLRCLDDTGRRNIKAGSIYRVKGLDNAGLLVVVDDDDQETSFEPERFEFI